MTEIKNLATKLLAIMDDVKGVKKDGKNEFHRYSYAKEEDVVKAVRDAMIKHGVFMATSVTESNHMERKTRKGDAENLVNVKIQATFIDSKSGESITSLWEGDGQDSGDKGIYKAYAGAIKYLLLKTFMIPTGIDPEADSRQAESNAPKAERNADNYERIAEALHGEGLLKGITPSTIIEELKELPTGSFEKALRHADKGDKEGLTKLAGYILGKDK